MRPDLDPTGNLCLISVSVVVIFSGRASLDHPCTRIDCVVGFGVSKGISFPASSPSIWYGGFLSHRGTPSHHPAFRLGFSQNPAMGCSPIFRAGTPRSARTELHDETSTLFSISDFWSWRRGMLLWVGPGLCVCGHQPLVWQQGGLYAIRERSTSTRALGTDLPKCPAPVLHGALDHPVSEFVPGFYLGTLEARGSSRRFGHLCGALECCGAGGWPPTHLQKWRYAIKQIFKLWR